MVSDVRAVIEREGPITVSRLARRTGLSERDVQAEVQELRLRGEPIVDAGVRGLRYTRDADELRHYIESRLDRARTILSAQKPLEETERRLRERVDLTLGLS